MSKQRAKPARRIAVAFGGVALFACGAGASAQAPADAPPTTLQPTVQTPTAAATLGGTIHGTAKAGTVPLPGVAITATNTLTGKKYATTTDVDGRYAMTIPRTGRYVVRAELAAFAPITNEVRITAEATDQAAEFTLQLLSRATQAQAAAGERTARAAAATLGAGTLALNMAGGDETLTDASAGGANTGAALPSLAALGGDTTANATSDAVTVSGAQGVTNALGGMSEDQIRSRVEDAMAQARQNGGGNGDQMNAVAAMIGGIMAGGGGFRRPGRRRSRRWRLRRPWGRRRRQLPHLQSRAAAWLDLLPGRQQRVELRAVVARRCNRSLTRPRTPTASASASPDRPTFPGLLQGRHAPVRLHQPDRPEKPECLPAQSGAGTHRARTCRKLLAVFPEGKRDAYACDTLRPGDRRAGAGEQPGERKRGNIAAGARFA